MSKRSRPLSSGFNKFQLLLEYNTQAGKSTDHRDNIRFSESQRRTFASPPPDKETQSRQRPETSGTPPAGQQPLAPGVATILISTLFSFYWLLHFLQETIHHIVHLLCSVQQVLKLLHAVLCTLGTGHPPTPPLPEQRLRS